jgi:hypothetical protein
MSIKQSLKLIGVFLFDVFLAKSSGDTFLVEGFDYEDENALFINTTQRKFYCIELSSAGNIMNFLSDRALENIITEYRELNHGSLVHVLYKKGKWQKNYIFSHDKKILEIIAADINVDFIDSLEMLNVIYDLYLNNSFNELDKQLVRDYVFSKNIKYETLEYSFNREVKEVIYNNFWDINVYQGKHNQNYKPTDISKLFNLNFEGSVWSYIDFTRSKVNAAIQARIAAGKWSGQATAFKQLKQDYTDNKESLVMMNTVLYLKEDNRTIAKQIGNHLNVDFREKKLHLRDLLRFSLFKKRDPYWDNFVNKKYLSRYISTVHKLHTDKADFSGIDINGAYWNYNLMYPDKKHKNKNAFLVQIGVTGSGKTSNMNKMLSQILKVDFYTGEADLETTNLRDFDVKYSGLPLADIVSRKNKVDRIKADLNGFKYNLLNLNTLEDGTLDKNELQMNILLISIILESMNKYTNEKAGLTSQEEGLFRELVEEIFEKNDYVTDRIIELEETHFEIYGELLQLGYTDIQRTADIKQDKFDFLKKPKLLTLVKVLKPIANQTADDKKAETAKTLLIKLELIYKFGIFSHYDTVNLIDTKYLYVDYESIKTLPQYVPIFLAIFNRIYMNDRKKQREREILGQYRPVIYYNFTEADNIFRQPSFESLLRALINEARSSNIRLIFSTQLIEQIPEHIIKQSGNLMCSFPASNKRAAIISDLNRLVKLSDKQVELLNRSPQYSFAMINEFDVSVVSQEFTQEEIDTYGQE